MAAAPLNSKNTSTNQCRRNEMTLNFCAFQIGHENQLNWTLMATSISICTICRNNSNECALGYAIYDAWCEWKRGTNITFYRSQSNQQRKKYVQKVNVNDNDVNKCGLCDAKNNNDNNNNNHNYRYDYIVQNGCHSILFIRIVAAHQTNFVDFIPFFLNPGNARLRTAQLTNVRNNGKFKRFHWMLNFLGKSYCCVECCRR